MKLKTWFAGAIMVSFVAGIWLSNRLSSRLGVLVFVRLLH